MEPSITINLSYDVFWPAIPEKRGCDCKRYLAFLPGKTVALTSEDGQIVVNLPAYGCPDCGWEYEDNYLPQLVRRILGQYLPNGPQLGLQPQVIDISKKKGVEIRF